LLKLDGTYKELYEMQTSWARRSRKIEPAFESLVLSLAATDREAQALLALDDVTQRAGDVASLARTVIGWSQSYLGAEAAAVLGVREDAGDAVVLAAEPRSSAGLLEINGVRDALADALESGEPAEVPLAAEHPLL